MVLRLTNLEAKPPWSDEWATLVFSLGHSFRTIPLDRIISLDTLLSPLQLDATTNAKDVVRNLLTESTHPPLYFVLTHWWLRLFSGESGLVSIWWGRMLSAVFGVLAIPAMFGWGWLLSRSLICTQLAAALMAVSPYGVYLSQEARHYTLAILWAIASLSCLVVAIRRLQQKRPLAIALVLSWIIVNNLGVATHYFFGLTLVAETIVLACFWCDRLRSDKLELLAIYWRRIYWAIAGTVSGCLVWVSLWRSIPGDELTSWIFDGNPLAEFYLPPLRLLVWSITMVFLLPVEGVSDSIAIISVVVLLGFIVWSIPSWLRALRVANSSPQLQLGITILTRFLLGAIALILAITYIFGADLTLSARFQFVYFPAVLLVLAIILGTMWQKSLKYRGFANKSKIYVLLTLCLATLGTITVVTNFAFQKVERPDLVVPAIIQAERQVAMETPILIATLHRTHGQTGEMMSIAWQFQQLLNENQLNWQPQFLLAHQATADSATAIATLERAIATMPHPFQLWLVNFAEGKDLAAKKCIPRVNNPDRATGYRYYLYRCLT